MSQEQEFDAVIIGAGPAGAACAYRLAKAGREVVLLERGDAPGSKNVSGGRFYTYALDLLDPELIEEAPLERKVTCEQIMMLADDRSINIEYRDPSFNKPGQTPMSCTVLRARFDEWLATQAEEQGAMLACGVRVDDLIQENGKVVGVQAGDEEMRAKIIIAADGVNSLMAQKAGLIDEIPAHNVGVGVKEIIELPVKTIEERFQLKPEEGAARVVLGCTDGIHGGGSLYTNSDCISLGCVFSPEAVAQRGCSVHELFQQFKLHPAIHALIEDGETMEYGAHLVSEAGYRGVPGTLHKPGFLMVGDAAGTVINTGYTIRGIDLAILSGIAAAEAILAAPEASEAGPGYAAELESLKLLPIMKAVDGYFDIMETPWLYDRAPLLAGDLFHELFSVTHKVPRKLKKIVADGMRARELSWWQLLKLGFKGVRKI